MFRKIFIGLVLPALMVSIIYPLQSWGQAPGDNRGSKVDEKEVTYYVHLKGGLAFPSRLEFDNNLYVDLDVGWYFSVAGGIDIQAFSIESELSLAEFDVSGIGGQISRRSVNVPVSGETSTTAFMVHGYFHPLRHAAASDSSGDPYVGFGFGIASAELTLPHLALTARGKPEVYLCPNSRNYLAHSSRSQHRPRVSFSAPKH